jgi:hypothetical protein
MQKLQIQAADCIRHLNPYFIGDGTVEGSERLNNVTSITQLGRTGPGFRPQQFELYSSPSPSTRGRSFYHSPHWTDEETEGQRGQESCTSHTASWPEFEPWSGLGPLALHPLAPELSHDHVDEEPAPQPGPPPPRLTELVLEAHLGQQDKDEGQAPLQPADHSLQLRQGWGRCAGLLVTPFVPVPTVVSTHVLQE